MGQLDQVLLSLDWLRSLPQYKVLNESWSPILDPPSTFIGVNVLAVDPELNIFINYYFTLLIPIALKAIY